MPASECFTQSFVVPGEPAEASKPSESSLHDPASWQQHEALFRFGVFDYFQLNAVIARLLRRVLTRVALVHKRDLDMVSCHFLDLFRQLRDLGTLLLVGRRDFPA